MTGSDWLLRLESGYKRSVIRPSLPTLWKLEVIVRDLASRGLFDTVFDLRELWTERVSKLVFYASQLDRASK